jgi:hypothetical protein
MQNVQTPLFIRLENLETAETKKGILKWIDEINNLRIQLNNNKKQFLLYTVHTTLIIIVLYYCVLSGITRKQDCQKKNVKDLLLLCCGGKNVIYTNQFYVQGKCRR